MREPEILRIPRKYSSNFVNSAKKNLSPVCFWCWIYIWDYTKFHWFCLYLTYPFKSITVFHEVLDVHIWLQKSLDLNSAFSSFLIQCTNWELFLYYLSSNKIFTGVQKKSHNICLCSSTRAMLLRAFLLFPVWCRFNFSRRQIASAKHWTR